MSSSAEMIIHNGDVFTSSSEFPSAEAVVIRGNRIAFVGSNSEAMHWRGPSTRMVDADGCTVMPGFIDGHIHLLKGSVALEDLRADSVTGYDELAAVLRTHANANADKPWVTGFGFHYCLGPGNASLSRQDLDRIIRDRPVFLVAYDLHTAWANTLALQQAGVFHGADCGANSEIVLDEHGEATGEIREFAAMDRIRGLLPGPSAEDRRRLLRKGLAYLASLGITSIHNMDGDMPQAQLYAELDESDELTTRIYLPYSVTPATPFETLEREAAAMARQYSSGKVRCRGIKLFMDGVIEAYTGLLLDDYADRPGECGASNYAADHFTRLIVEADRLGLQIAAHAVGDGGVRRVLDAYEAAAYVNHSTGRRHRIEHIELVQPADAARFAALGVLASMQPLHAPPNGEDGDVWLPRIGPTRWPRSFAWSMMRAAGAPLVFGSDWPCVSASPLLGLHNATNRMPWKKGLPHHRQTLEDALLSYTQLAASAEFQEDSKGQIKPGYLADLVLLSADIQRTPAEQLVDVKPLMTIMDGRIVFQA